MFIEIIVLNIICTYICCSFKILNTWTLERLKTNCTNTYIKHYQLSYKIHQFNINDSNYQNIKYLFKLTYYYYYVIFISEIIINKNDNNETYFERRGLFNCCTCKIIYF